MARLARVVVHGIPHHVTQRGNRRQPIFFEAGDEAVYCALLGQECRRRGVEVWAYCLMPNHVHLILTPADERGLALAVGEAHRRYTGFINARAGWTGHLFQSRFASVPMDEDHLAAAARYVALNPVRARLVQRARDWAWSSTRAHIAGADDVLVTVRPLLERFGDFAALVAEGEDVAGSQAIRAAETTGRPLGSAAFVERLERVLGRKLVPGRPGRKPRPQEAGPQAALWEMGIMSPQYGRPARPISRP
ncbi:transposase [Caulobacter sp. KR2-114]|uniref:transposase n=1 Tax=Caulobacter sp. KR2-114 TaxID=3400912 RepID=UPI003C0670FC